MPCCEERGRARHRVDGDEHGAVRRDALAIQHALDGDIETVLAKERKEPEGIATEHFVRGLAREAFHRAKPSRLL